MLLGGGGNQNAIENFENTLIGLTFAYVCVRVTTIDSVV